MADASRANRDFRLNDPPSFFFSVSGKRRVRQVATSRYYREASGEREKFITLGNFRIPRRGLFYSRVGVKIILRLSIKREGLEVVSGIISNFPRFFGRESVDRDDRSGRER